jgi:glycerophosphoryl diester phosphodiesterase
LHGRGVAENSRGAFAAAAGAGWGIECDVRLSADRVPFVFHDARLERLTGSAGRIGAMEALAVETLRLRDGSAIPRLSAMLSTVGQGTPVLVEVKSGRGHAASLCAAVANALPEPVRPVAVMSFDARVPGWFAATRRTVTRGLVFSCRQHPRHAIGRRLALAIARARPHFLAMDVRDLDRLPWDMPALRALPLLCWTVRTGADRARARRHGAQIIFEQTP